MNQFPASHGIWDTDKFSFWDLPTTVQTLQTPSKKLASLFSTSSTHYLYSQHSKNTLTSPILFTTLANVVKVRREVMKDGHLPIANKCEVEASHFFVGNCSIPKIWL